MDKVRVYLNKVSKTIEGTTSEVSAQIGNQINSDLMSLLKEITCVRQMII
jgi:tetrahydromethanopterin S-methyltransferase subunit G